MRDLMAAELLEVWERGSAQRPPERALTLLDSACPDFETDTLARLSIGRRDGLLLSVRESTFGSRFVAITNCPDCHEQLELDFDVDDVRVSDGEVEPGDPATLSVDGYELRFRLPDSRDLMIAGAMRDGESIRAALLERCLLTVHSKGRETSIDRLPKDVVAKLEEEMSRLDAQASVQVELECPSCRRGWTAAFDILAFFWSELDAWAQRLLVEVHTLASAYGWREMDILEMSAARRNIYLNMVSG